MFLPGYRSDARPEAEKPEWEKDLSHLQSVSKEGRMKTREERQKITMLQRESRRRAALAAEMKASGASKEDIKRVLKEGK